MRTLLLVDDSRATLAAEKALFEARSLRVFATDTATEVPDLAADLQPDLIVLEYEMPGMKGDEVCLRLKSRRDTQHIPTLVLSGQEDERIRRACIESGATAFMKKREGREALLDQVAELLGIRYRRHVRVACQIKAVVGCGGEFFDGVIHNLSAGGVYLSLRRELPIGKGLRIKFRLPDVGFELRVFSEIVRAEALPGAGYAYGIQLLEANEATLTALAEFVQRESRRQEVAPIPGR